MAPLEPKFKRAPNSRFAHDADRKYREPEFREIYETDIRIDSRNLRNLGSVGIYI